MHFATSGEDISNMGEHDSVMWKIDIEELNDILPEVFKQKLKEENAFLFTVKMLDEVVEDLSKYDVDMGE